VVQAVGGGALIPGAIALASERLPGARKAMVFGIVGAAAETGAVLGPLYGGVLIELLGWRWIFWTNLPVVGVLLFAMIAVPEIKGTGGRLDLKGGLLLAGGLALITGALSQRSLFTLDAVLPFVVVAVALVVIAALIYVESHADEPVIAKALFASRRFAAAMSAQLLVGAALIMALVTVPLMSDTVLGQDPLEGGLRLMRFTGAIPFGALLGGFSVRWFGVRLPTIVGLLLGAVGFILMSTWDQQIADPALTLHLAIGGFGFGLVIAPLVLSVVESASETYQATAAAWVTVSRMLGMTLGLAALAAWGMGEFQLLTSALEFPLRFAGEASDAYQARITAYQDGVTGASLEVFTAFFRVGAALTLAAIVPSLFINDSANTS